MNQKRSWPRVPNRYRLTPPRKLIRPKSMATVVVVFRSTPAVSSMPVPRSLSTSSVRSGRISLIVRTSVVLPTPNPPAMMILVMIGAAARSEGLESIEHIPHHAQVGYRAVTGPPEHRDKPFLVQVAEQDPDHRQRQVDIGGHVGDDHGTPAHGQDSPVFGAQPGHVRQRRAGRRHHVDEIERLPPGPGAAPGKGIGPDDRPGLLVKPSFPGPRHPGGPIAGKSCAVGRG